MNNQNNKILYGIGGIVIGIILVSVLTPMMRYGSFGMMGWRSGNTQVASTIGKHFIEQMIPHHQLAIMMANMLQSGTNRPEMQQLAKNIISSQSKEIQQMQAWYVQ